MCGSELTLSNKEGRLWTEGVEDCSMKIQHVLTATCNFICFIRNSVIESHSTQDQVVFLIGSFLVSYTKDSFRSS